MSAIPLVAVVEDDLSVRQSLVDLLGELGCAVRAFGSAEEFLASDGADATDCLILDVELPGMSGPALQQQLARRRRIPIIFITADPSATIRSSVIARGAVACLSKPFSETVLLAALDAALARTG